MQWRVLRRRDRRPNAHCIQWPVADHGSMSPVAHVESTGLRCGSSHQGAMIVAWVARPANVQLGLARHGPPGPLSCGSPCRRRCAPCIAYIEGAATLHSRHA